MKPSTGPDEELSPESFVGQTVTIRETDNTRRHGIAGGPGYVEGLTADGKLRVIYTGRFFEPAGPYDLDADEVELKQ